MRLSKCIYCDREGNSKAGGSCGFCDNGKPLDSEEDWEKSWQRVFDYLTKKVNSSKLGGTVDVEALEQGGEK